ncbi:S1C family serine protease [Chryseosolibacter indicus]|uniref:Trypsin-like peptidase domain-containing protein n=1 Tax=Chryseosolibacter indicus TaxID=2782351 RepID=A0ABS5VN36_9BACT|nr:trypsin-like peptidase domain-containing protein [Chryseosolibacter indicus]MBT1702867.1 trypsin-like peptidase domain-containing protein [Chryseosolibacter indicus]
MKILGQLLIALVGGIVAIFLYKSFEKDDTSASNTIVNPLAKRTSYTGSSAADSINNVFSVGFGEAAETTLKQVVHIRSRIAARAQRNPFYDFFGDEFWQQQYKNREWQEEQLQEASGSGVIVSNDGYIVTNNHVIDNAQEVIVSLSSGRDYKAKVVGADPSTDLAVLKIDESNLPVAKLANSDEVRVGDWVLAVGNPFNLASTVTAGIVSAKARNIHILSDNSAIESFIQTDAAVNPGNSGGALVNLRGELVGINTAIATPTGTFAGYAFAVPSNIVKRVMDDLIKHGEVQRGYLGVVIQDLNGQLAKEMGLDISQGVVVANLARNGAAQKAGIKIKDVISEINGTAIQSTPQLMEIVASHKPGDVLNVTVQREGKKKEVSVKLQEAKELVNS